MDHTCLVNHTTQPPLLENYMIDLSLIYVLVVANQNVGAKANIIQKISKLSNPHLIAKTIHNFSMETTTNPSMGI